MTRPPRVIGKNSVESLQSGIIYGFPGMAAPQHMPSGLINTVLGWFSGTPVAAEVYRELLRSYDEAQRSSRPGTGKAQHTRQHAHAVAPCYRAGENEHRRCARRHDPSGTVVQCDP